MAIKLFFKHLMTGIRRRPAQPLLLVLVVVVAIAVCVISLQLGGFMAEEADAEFSAAYGNANITISVSASMKTRFMDASVVKETIGEDAKTCGIYALPFDFGDEKDFIYGVATDIQSVGDIFDVQFASGGINTDSRGISRGIYITSEVAEKYNLTIDSDIVVEILGAQKKYFVYGISDNLLLGKYDAMVDYQSARSLTTMTELLGYKPCGTIYVHTESDVEEDIVALQATKAYSSASIIHATPDISNIQESMDSISVIIMLMSLVLAIFTIYACFSILTAQRKEENALFYAVGAKSYMLNLLSLAEMFIYWLFGFLAGIGASIGVIKLFGAYVGFQYCVPTLKADAMATSGAVVLAATEMGMGLFILVDAYKKKKIKQKKVVTKNEKVSNLAAILVLVATVICTVLAIVTNRIPKRIFGIVGVVGVLTTAFLGTKQLFVWVAGRVSGSTKIAVPVRYAIKNASKVESQSNVSGLFAMFLTILTMILIMLNFATQSNVLYERTIDADYLIANTPMKTMEKLVGEDGCESVDTVYQIYVGDCLDPNGLLCTALCSNEKEAFNEKFDVQVMPVGAQVLLAEPYMENFNLSIGDYYSLQYGGQTYTMEIIGTVKMNSRMAIVDADYMGIEYNYLAVRGKSDYTLDELYDQINIALEEDSAVITPISELIASAIKDNENSINCIEIITIAMVLFAIIGLGDSIVSGYRSRRDEFECYAAAGMNKRTIRIMKISETLYSLLFGIVCYLLIVGIAVTILFETCLGYSMNLLYI